MTYKILLVEDNPHIMEINSETLTMEGYEVVEAPDGKTCLSVLQSQQIDLAILDIMLPDADGLELCRQIKREHDIPIIFLSALGENSQIIDGLRAGGDDYLPKPYDLGVQQAKTARWKRSYSIRKFSSNMRQIFTYSTRRLATKIISRNNACVG